MTVCVVDDEPITRLDLCQMLKGLGFSVVGDASDGFDAVELCKKYKPDVVLMDIKMPIFDGLSASETIVSGELAGCVVLLTAYCDGELIERANQIGVTGYLVKPVEERLLLPTISVAFAQSERLRAARKEAADAQLKLEEDKLIGRAKTILAKENGVSETEALRQLQRLAMDKRRSIASLARVVVEKNSQREIVNRAKLCLMQNGGISENEAYRYIQDLAQNKKIDLAAASREIIASGKGKPKAGRGWEND